MHTNALCLFIYMDNSPLLNTIMIESVFLPSKNFIDNIICIMLLLLSLTNPLDYGLFGWEIVLILVLVVSSRIMPVRNWSIKRREHHQHNTIASFIIARFFGAFSQLICPNLALLGMLLPSLSLVFTDSLLFILLLLE